MGTTRKAKKTDSKAEKSSVKKIPSRKTAKSSQGKSFQQNRAVSDIQIPKSFEEYASLDLETDELLRFIVDGTAFLYGQKFFDSLVKHFAASLNVDFAFISEMREKNSTLAHILSIWNKDKHGENFEYDIVDTPCEKVVNGKICIYTNNVDELFPKDVWLKANNIKSYLAIPLFDSKGNPLGHMGGLHSKPLRKTKMQLSILKIFAARAASELERTRTEAAENRSKAMFEALFNAEGDAIVFTGTERNITLTNNSLRRLFGYDEIELIGQKTEILYASLEEYEKQGKIRFNLNAEEMEKPYEVMYKKKNGELFVGETVGSIVKNESGEPLGFKGIIRDITKRKRVEEALKENAYFLEESQRVANIGSYALDISSGSWSSTNILNKIFGIKEQNFTRNVEGWLQIVHPDHREEMQSYFQNHVLGNRKRFDKEYQIVRQDDGMERWVHGLGELILDENNNPVKMLGTIQDITERKKSEMSLRLSEERYRLLVEGVNLIGWEYDPAKEQFTFVSGQAREITGYESEKWYEPGFWEKHIHQDDREEAVEFCKTATKKRENHDFEYRMIRADGTVIWFRDIVQVVSKQGDQVSLRGILIDITDKKKAEEELRLIQYSLDRAPFAVYWMEPDGKFIYVNQTACHIMGYSREELLSMGVKDIDPSLPNGVPPEMSEATKNAEFIQVESQHRTKEGHIFPCEVVVSYIEFGGKGYHCSFVRDITDRKKTEKELHQAKDTAEKATLLKDKFVSLVSHDLQSPLSSMLGLLKFIRDNEAEIKNDGAKQIIEGAINSGVEMSNLINDLLDITRLRTGALRPMFNFFDAKQIGARMVVNFEHLASRKGIQLINDIPRYTRVYGDLALLTQAVQNLVTNAIKFCKEGDSIRLFVPEVGKSTICVQDTGLGINAKLIENIFEYSGKTSSKGTAGEPGTGLGLPYVKEIVDAHKGKISLSTKEGEGCLFSITLPYKRPQILLVDDDIHFKLLLARYMKDMDVDIIQSENGIEAFEEVKKSLPNLVITDIEMPLMNGLELVKRMQEKEETKSVPIIVVTGEHGMELRDEVFGLGAKDFVTKESGYKEINPRVRRFIS